MDFDFKFDGYELRLMSDKRYCKEGTFRSCETRLKNWKDYLKYFDVGKTQIEFNENINGLCVSEGWLNGLGVAIDKSCDFSPDNTHLIDKTQKIRETMRRTGAS